MKGKKKKKPVPEPLDATEFYADTEAGLTGDLGDEIFHAFEAQANPRALPTSGELDGTDIAAAFDHDAMTEGVGEFYDSPTEADEIYAQTTRGAGTTPSDRELEGPMDASEFHDTHEARAKMTSKERLAREKQEAEEEADDALEEVKKTLDDNLIDAFVKTTLVVVLAGCVMAFVYWAATS